MNILFNILAVLFCLILGYIFGSIPTAVWIGKVFFHRDPRLEGSKNAGGTNAGRLFGKKFAKPPKMWAYLHPERPSNGMEGVASAENS